MEERITGIEPQLRHKDRVSVFVDGEFAVGIHAEVAAGAGLRVGDLVDSDALRDLARREETRRAREAALPFLGYRARSRKEVERKLASKGFEPEVVAETLATLARAGLLDDAEFSRSWVRARTGSRPLGPARIAGELRQKGVDRELIAEALATVDADGELAMAIEAGRAKAEQLRGEDPRTARRKLGQTLARRGFSWEVCSRAVCVLLSVDD